MMLPEDMTLTTAREELQSIASSIETDKPSEAERLRVVAEFLEGFGDALKEGMNGIVQELTKGE